MKQRLYWHLYVALLGSALVCLTVTAIAFRVWRDSGGPPAERLRRAAVTVPEQIPDVQAPDLAARLGRLADDLGLEIIVGDESGPLAGSPSPRAFPVPHRPRFGWRRERIGPGPVLVAPLDGGGWVAFRPRGAFAPLRPWRVHPFFTTLAVLAIVMALGSYPAARWVTRRLEALARVVERWGRGELGHRAAVSGSDEVAVLAATFNRAAERLDVLMDQQRQMLANASHELRSPLARLRMGLELIAEEPDGERRRDMVQRIHRDIVELDSLIEDVLLFSRADARVPRRALASVDIRALLTEEADRTGATVVEGARPTVSGDAALLRHLIRNLLENAQQHGGGGPVVAGVTADGKAVQLTVDDHGPGVPEEDREHIFAPFFRRAEAGHRDAAGPSAEVRPSGYGLGLALVRQVARYHGGDARYQPRSDGGSRFEVTFPLPASPA